MATTIINAISNLFWFGHSENEPVLSSDVSEKSCEETDTNDSNGKTNERLSEEHRTLHLEDTESEQNESEKNEYTLASAKWTPEWPGDLEKEIKLIKSPAKKPSLDPSMHSCSKRKNFKKRTSRKKKTWTPDWWDDFSRAMDSDSSEAEVNDERPKKKLISSIKDPKKHVGSRGKKVVSFAISISDESNETLCDEELDRTWKIDLGSNRNYIKSMVNRVNSDWVNASRKDSSRLCGGQICDGGRWTIEYDNRNYIRSQLHPELVKRIQMKRHRKSF